MKLKEALGFHQLETLGMTLNYGSKVIIEEMNLYIDKPEIISIIGPNGAGKSTVLKALARLITPKHGTVFLDGRKIQTVSSRETAQILAILPQSTFAPQDISVKELVSAGRAPYRGYFSTLTVRDHQVIARVMELTGISQFADRLLITLSGGEKQRVWLAMALAQEPKILLLDEPTTYLDIHHQLEMMKLVRRLHQELGIVVVMVLHDLNHAARFSDRIIAIKDGVIFADGSVEEVLTEENFELLYGVKAHQFKLCENEEEYRVFIPYEVCSSKG